MQQRPKSARPRELGEQRFDRLRSGLSLLKKTAKELVSFGQRGTRSALTGPKNHAGPYQLLRQRGDGRKRIDDGGARILRPCDQEKRGTAGFDRRLIHEVTQFRIVLLRAESECVESVSAELRAQGREHLGDVVLPLETFLAFLCRGLNFLRPALRFRDEHVTWLEA